MQRQIFLQLYQRVNIFQWKQHQITDFPFFLFFISGIYRQFDPESRLADHFSVILFRPACAPSPVLRFSFYCKLLQLSPGTFFLSDVQDGSISDQWKNSDPADNKPPFFHIRRKPAGHVLRIPERSGSVHVSHFHWQAADGSFFCCRR